MKMEFVRLGLQVGWTYAVACYADRVSRTQLELWVTEFKANGGY